MAKREIVQLENTKVSIKNWERNFRGVTGKFNPDEPIVFIYKNENQLEYKINEYTPLKVAKIKIKYLDIPIKSCGKKSTRK